MKTRHGFVSNSSSSSFIVALDEIPKCVRDVEKVFYPKGGHVHADYYDEVLTAQEAAEKIWLQLEGQEPLTSEKILDEINCGYFGGYPSPDYNPNAPYCLFEKEFRSKTGKTIQECEETHESDYKKWFSLLRKSWEDRDAKIKEAAKEYFNKYKDMFENKKAFVLNFGDDVDGQMEHGNAFNNVKHLRISHH